MWSNYIYFIKFYDKFLYFLTDPIIFHTDYIIIMVMWCIRHLYSTTIRGAFNDELEPSTTTSSYKKLSVPSQFFDIILWPTQMFGIVICNDFFMSFFNINFLNEFYKMIRIENSLFWRYVSWIFSESFVVSSSLLAEQGILPEPLIINFL